MSAQFTFFWGAYLSHQTFKIRGRLVSAGLERLVYTEKVGGSNPSAPTTIRKIVRAIRLIRVIQVFVFYLSRTARSVTASEVLSPFLPLMTTR